MTSAQTTVLRQLADLRRDNKISLERHIEDRRQLARLVERMEQGFDDVRSDIRALTAEVQNLQSGVLRFQDRILNAHNEILEIGDRLDQVKRRGFEYVEVETNGRS